MNEGNDIFYFFLLICPLLVGTTLIFLIKKVRTLRSFANIAYILLLAAVAHMRMPAGAVVLFVIFRVVVATALKILRPNKSP
jgi:hypothetical protein